MASATATCQPRTSDRGVLYSVVREHLETFLAEMARAAGGAHLPEFVEHEFRDFLTCGVLAHGLAPEATPSSADSDYRRLMFVGTTGSGKTPGLAVQ